VETHSLYSNTLLRACFRPEQFLSHRAVPPYTGETAGSWIKLYAHFSPPFTLKRLPRWGGFPPAHTHTPVLPALLLPRGLPWSTGSLANRRPNFSVETMIRKERTGTGERLKERKRKERKRMRVSPGLFLTSASPWVGKDTQLPPVISHYFLLLFIFHIKRIDHTHRHTHTHTQNAIIIYSLVLFQSHFSFLSGTKREIFE